MIIEKGHDPHDEDVNHPLDVKWVMISNGKTSYSVRAENTEVPV